MIPVWSPGARPPHRPGRVGERGAVRGWSEGSRAHRPRCGGPSPGPSALRHRRERRVVAGVVEPVNGPPHRREAAQSLRQLGRGHGGGDRLARKPRPDGVAVDCTRVGERRRAKVFLNSELDRVSMPERYQRVPAGTSVRPVALIRPARAHERMREPSVTTAHAQSSPLDTPRGIPPRSGAPIRPTRWTIREETTRLRPPGRLRPAG